MELLLTRALKASRKRYKPSTLEVMASRWRSFCLQAAPHLDSSGTLDEAGLAKTLTAFPTYTTRKRHFLLFKWVVQTLNRSGLALPDPTPSLEKDYSGEERTLHAVNNLESLAQRMAQHARATVSGWKGVRLAALAALLGETGLRSEDVRLLSRQQISLGPDGGLLTLVQKGKPTRELPLSKETALLVQDWLTVRPSTPGELVFVADESGRSLDPSTLWRQLKRLEQQVGAVDGEVSGTTAIRAAFAAQLRDQGKSLEEIQLALGHRKLSSTAELLERVRRGQSTASRSNSS